MRIYEPGGSAPAGFEPIPATLEDAYLVLLRTEGLGLPAIRSEATAGSSDPLAGVMA